MDAKEIILETDRFMREHVPKTRINKDGTFNEYLNHVLGVRKYALLLADKYDADRFIVEVAALLHDTGAYVGEDHALESAKISRVFLKKFNLADETIEKIIKCIERHSMGSSTEAIEEQIIQDADGIIFIEDTYRFFFEKQKQKHSLEEARTISIKKTKGMMDKIKTEQGIKLANKFLEKSLKFLESAT